MKGKQKISRFRYAAYLPARQAALALILLLVIAGVFAVPVQVAQASIVSDYAQWLKASLGQISNDISSGLKFVFGERSPPVSSLTNQKVTQSPPPPPDPLPKPQPSPQPTPPTSSFPQGLSDAILNQLAKIDSALTDISRIRVIEGPQGPPGPTGPQGPPGFTSLGAAIAHSSPNKVSISGNYESLNIGHGNFTVDEAGNITSVSGFSGQGISGTSLTITGKTTFNGVAYTWPSADGSTNQVLATNGSGALSWTTTSGTPSGSGNVNQLAFWTATSTLSGSSTFVWDNTLGRLGIGDSTPDHTLDVAGNIGLSTSGFINFGDTTGSSGYGLRDNAGTIQFKDSGGSWSSLSALGSVGGTGSSGQISFWTATSTLSATSTFTWDNTSGFLGIGATTPVAPLTITADSLTTATGVVFSFDALSSGTGVDITSSSALMTGNLLNLEVSGTTASGVPLYVKNYGTGLSFRVDDASGDTTPFVIDASGNVGIGTVNPVDKLQVVGGQIVADNTNNASVPRYAFTGDLDTGVGYCGADQMCLTTGGSSKITLTSSQILIGYGSATAPVFSFNADTDTGFFRPASNTFAISTAGGERMRIDGSGNVGIGTTSPGARLTVHETADTASNLVAILRGNDRTTPADNDNSYITFTLEDDAGTQAEFARLTWQATDVTSSTKDGLLKFSTQVNNTLTDVLTINGDEVGINVASPLATLHVDGANTEALRLQTPSSGNGYVGIEISDSGDLSDDMQLIVKPNTGSAAYFVFSDKGHLGINGVTSGENPDAELDIYLPDAANGGMIIDQVNAGDYDPFLKFQLGSTAQFTLGVDDSDSDKFKIGTTALDTNTRLTIDSSGFVGIGTASPASRLHLLVDDANTASTVDLLTLDHTVTATSSAGIGSGILFRAENDGGATVNTGQIAGSLTDVTSGSEDGILTFSTRGPNGAALAERMRIDSAGRVGIATTTPLADLDIAKSGGNPTLLRVEGTKAEYRWRATEAGVATGGLWRIRLSSLGFDFDKNIAADGSFGGFSRALRLGVVGLGAVDTQVDALSFLSDSDTGIFSPVNDALGFAAGGLERMRLSSANLGIATSTPTWKLHVWDGGICVDAVGGGDCPAEVAGAVAVDTGPGASTATSVISFDIAERYPSTQTLEAGDLVTGDPDNPGHIKKSSQPYQSDILGIVSAKPAISMEGSTLFLAPTFQATSTNPNIALAGRVPVRVSLENGPIKQGDMLTSSSEPGVAMKATQPGRVIGMALGEPDENNMVLTFVNPHWFVGSLDENGLLSGAQEAETEEGFIARVKRAIESLTGTIKTAGEWVFEKIVAKRAEVETVQVKRFEVEDAKTGDIYCTWIENGEWVKLQAKCDKVQYLNGQPIIVDRPAIHDDNGQEPNSKSQTNLNDHNSNTQTETPLDFDLVEMTSEVVDGVRDVSFTETTSPAEDGTKPGE